VVADNGVVIHYVANNPGGKFKTVADKEFVPEQYGLRLKKGNAELQAKVDKGLADIKADGTYAKIYAKYFGAAPRGGNRFRPAAVPPSKAGPAAPPMDLRWEILAGYGPLFASGLWMTIQLTLVAIGAGLVLGVASG
jgi:hypothetical protein